jgi:hypothetical protein
MDIYVFDKSLTFVGIIDNYSSLIWDTHYYGYGDFEIYAGVNDISLDLIQPDFYLCRKQDVGETTLENIMVINTINITTDHDAGDYIAVTGRGLKSICDKRVVAEQIQLNGTLQQCIYSVLKDNFVSPTETLRTISNFTLDTKELDGLPTVTMQVTGRAIGEWIQSICMAYGYGWDIRIDGTDFVFYLYNGTDRSYLQDVNGYVIFSPNFDNLIASEYLLDKNSHKNSAVIAGEGEGLDRRTVIVGDASGIDRDEIYIDARDLSSDDGAISDADYNAAMQERASEEISKYLIQQTFSAELELRNYRLGTDFSLGDTVQIINEYGIEASAKMIEIVESEDESGRKIVPTFKGIGGG